MDAKRERWITAALCAAVLLSMLLFFELAHPLVILDADDWTYISESRAAIPSPEFWNPARVLPEILMPWASGLGVLLFGGLGYIRAITLMNGLVLSLFITGYVLAFYRLLVRRLGLDAGKAALLSGLFLLLHFSLQRTAPEQNLYLFWAKDVTCVYYYVIPALLNCTLVMVLSCGGLHRRLWEPGELWRKALLIAAAYLAVFSNLFESAILACWCGLDLLAALLRQRKERKALRRLLGEQSFSLGVALLWLLSVWFESRGGRGAAAAALPPAQALGQSLKAALGFFGSLYKLALLPVIAGLLALPLLRLWRYAPEEKKPCGRLLLPLALVGLLLALFQVLLCARVNPGYAGRGDVQFGCCFALLALSLLSLGLLLRRWEKLTLLLPLALLILFSLTNTRLRSFADSNDILAPASLCTAMDQDLVDQVLAAQARGERSVTVHVADFGSEDNWPQSTYMGGRIASSLYKHGITEELMDISIQPDREVNRRFHLPLYDGT